MTTLIVATTCDLTSINPAAALLSIPGWSSCASLSPDMKSFSNRQVRMLHHDRHIVEEDDLDRRWEEATGESVNEVIFLSRHTAASNKPALTVHPIGVPFAGWGCSAAGREARMGGTTETEDGTAVAPLEENC